MLMASTLDSVNDIEDAFYLERLDAFKQKNLADVAAFAARENKNPDEVLHILALINFTRWFTFIKHTR